MGTLKPIDLEAIQERIAAQQGASPQTHNENARRLESRTLMTHLWELMARMYGHKWSSAFGDEIDPGNVWATVLHDCDIEKIRHGFRKCMEQGLEWPPSAPEFRRLCLDQSEVSWEHKRIEAADRERQRVALQDLRNEEQKQAQADAALAGIRDLLKMGARNG